ncbi:MAG: porin [Candidatus Acidiferrales bacterium]
MRWPTRWLVLLAVCFFAPGTLVYAQSDKPADDRTKPASAAATEEEVEQLRREVADLKATIQQLVEINHQQGAGGGHLVQASANPSDSGPAPEPTAADISVLQKEIEILQKKANDAPPATSGWNGEHFFLKSSDGNFTLMPVGYLNAQYLFYKGDGAPPDTFGVRVARFGVQGSYGKQLDFGFVFDSAASNGISIRDMYMDFKPWSTFKVQAGQFKVPFSQEVGTGYTSVEFYNRSIGSVLYPDANGSFRTPGFDIHGDLFGGALQYWTGLFNGRGILTTGSTNEPEVVGRVRIAPWRKSSNQWLKGFAIGGSVQHSRSKGLANELSFSGLMNDNTYTFFPQFRINGGIERYNGHFMWLKGSLGVRGEYTQILMKRDGIGSEASIGSGFQTLPGVVGKSAYAQATYLLTGEKEPENAAPRVKHPVIGPNSPGETGGPGWGAWMVKFRYSWLEGRAKGATFDSGGVAPTSVPTFSDHTDQFTAGFNWYMNYWVLLKFDFNVDRLNTPSVQGILPRNYFVAVQGVQFRF